MASKLWGVVGLALSFGCGNAKETAPRTPATHTGSATPPATSAQGGGRAAPTSERAADFQRRGVLDRAAAAFRELFASSGDPAQLSSAAELYEKALSLSFAAECYAELERFPEFSARAKAGSQRIGAIGTETYFDHETSKAAEALLSRAREQVARGELAEARETLTRDQELRIDRFALSLLGSVHWRSGNRVAAQQAWAQARGVSRIPLAAATVRALPAFYYAPEELVFRDDSLWFATAGGFLLAYDPRLRSFEWLDAQTGDLEQLAPHREVPELWSFMGVRSRVPELAKKVTAIASRDGKRAAWLTSEQVTYFAPDRAERLEPVWRYAMPRNAPPRDKRPRPATFSSAAFTPGTSETERLFVGQSDGTIRVLSAAGKELFAFAAHDGEVTELALSSDGTLLATAGSDKKAHVWELASPRRRISVDVAGEARSLAFFPDDDTLELAHSWDLVRYDARTGQERSRLHRGVEFLRVEHSPSKLWTAVGHYKTDSLDVYEGTNAEPFAVTSSQALDVHFALARDQSAIALAASTGVFAVELEPFRVVRLNDTYASRVAFSPSGRFIAAVHEKEVRVYPRAGGAAISTIVFGSVQPRGLTFHGESELALLAHAQTRVFTVSNGQERPPASDTRRYPLAEGELVFSGGTLERRTRTGRVAESIDRVSAAIAVNQAGTYFAYQRANELVIRSTDGGSQARALMGYTPEHLALSSSGKRAAAAIFPHRVVVFDLGTGTQYEVRAGHHGGLGGVNALAFYGDGLVLASGSDGLLALDDQNPGFLCGLHLLESGAWFSVVNRTFSTFVDGDESGIDASAAFPYGSPGLYWEAFRSDGSFAQLLRGKLPPDE